MTTTTFFKRVISELKSLTENFSHPVYAVGGCVRDLILGVPSHDIDIVVDYPEGEQELAKFLQERYPEKIKNFVPNIKFGTNRFTLVLEDGTEEQIDCAMTRVESYAQGSRKPEEVGYAGVNIDALRRDFTLNALYYDIRTNNIIDPTGKGQEDLKNGILRTPLNPAETFNEDSLRMMRAVRFKHCKGFKLSNEVFEGIKSSASSISSTAVERISEEFCKILLSKTPVEGIRDLHETGLLSYILPEFDNYWGMDQRSRFHNLSFTDHCLEVLRKVAEKSDSLELRMAALLHDIAKPQPEGHQEKEDGRWTYVGHDIASRKLALQICLERFRLSKATSLKIANLIGWHMIIKNNWDSNSKSYKGKDSGIRKAIRILGEDLEDELILIDADNCSHAPEHCMPGQVEQFKEKASKLEIADYSKPLVNGNEVEELLGVKPGKAIKLFLDVVNVWRDENPSLTKDDLPRLIREQRNFSKELVAEINNSKR